MIYVWIAMAVALIVSGYVGARRAQRLNGMTRENRRHQTIAHTPVLEDMVRPTTGFFRKSRHRDADVVADVVEDAQDHPNGAYLEEFDMLDPHHHEPEQT
jgi:hypothetical protein